MLLIFTSQLYATSNESTIQQQEIKGTVTGADNSPLPGVNILVVGTTNGTETDFDGNYTIKANAGDVLQFSFVGMDTQTATVGDSNTINITMTEDANALEEVVVVGYGSQRKADVTGAVSTISADELVSFPTSSAEQALQGKAAGVTIINSGSPGGAPIVRIRGISTYGNNTPIFVVDGVITPDISNLSPNDIESMSVLKDASTTAVYGSLGANGVVIVKTKSGRKGEVVFDFTSYLSTQSKPKTYDVLNADQYVAFATALQTNASEPLPARLTDPQYTDYIKNNTDWQDLILQTGVIQDYQLSAGGGTEKANFRFSAGHQKQVGVILNTDSKKYTFRLNSSFKTGKFTFGENVSIAFKDRNPQINNSSFSPFEHAIKMAPYLPVHNADNLGGFQGPETVDGQDATNPVRSLTLAEVKERSSAILGNVYGVYSIIDGLDYKAELGINYANNTRRGLETPYVDGLAAQSKTITSIGSFESTNLTFRNSLRYTKTINENHNLEILVLAEKDKRKTNVFRSQGQTDFGFQQIPANSPSSSELYIYNKVGYLGRVNYNYDGKYIFAASLRRDASSRFGPNNRWGTFPSVAAGWVLSKEDFLGESAMNLFKIRGSWGVAGNDKSAGDYSFSSVFTEGFNYGPYIGLAIPRLSNTDLKWEETIMTNIGVDLGFLNNAITASIEYYINESSDLIVLVPPSLSSGFTQATPRNIGAMETKGVEFNLGYNDREGDFTWSADLNLSTTKNEVIKLADNIESLNTGGRGGVFGGSQVARTVEGESFNHFYGWQTDGIFQNPAEVASHATQTGAAPGDIRFKDVNGDNVIDAKDKTIIGNPFPDLTYGLTLNAAYKNFDFSVFFNGVSGNDITNTMQYFLKGTPRIFNAGTAVLDSWTPTNASTTQPRAITGDPNKNTRFSDRYVEDGSYTRLKNLSIGYNFTDSVLKSFAGGSIHKFRIYISGQNLLTFTDYSGLDPELGYLNSTNETDIGIDKGQYPSSVSLLAGLQITF